MSVANLLEERDSAVVWRGPRKTAIIKRFVKDTFWGRLDYLIFDIPQLSFWQPQFWAHGKIIVLQALGWADLFIAAVIKQLDLGNCLLKVGQRDRCIIYYTVFLFDIVTNIRLRARRMSTSQW